MEKIQYFLLISIFITMGNSTGLDESVVFPFNEVLYQEICSPQITSSFLDYTQHVIFSKFYTTLQSRDLFDGQEIIEAYSQHAQLITNYLNEIKTQARLINDKSMTQMKQLYFKKRLTRLMKDIIMIIGNKDSLPFKDSPQKTEIQEIFEKFFIGKFDQIDQNNNVVQFFIDESKQFGESEIQKTQDLTTLYFKNELCNLQFLIPKSLSFYTNESDGGSTIGEQMTFDQQDKLKHFFNNFITLEYNGCSTNGMNDIWTEILSILIPGMDYDHALKLVKNSPDFPQLSESYLEMKFIKERNDQKLILRDKYITYFMNEKQFFDLDRFAMISRIKIPIHYSPLWMQWLNDLPKFVELNKILPKDLAKPKFMEFGEDIMDDFYDLYNIARLQKKFNSNTPQDVIGILEILLGVFTEINNKPSNKFLDIEKIQINQPYIAAVFTLILKKTTDDLKPIIGDLGLERFIGTFQARPDTNPELAKIATDLSKKSILLAINSIDLTDFEDAIEDPEDYKNVKEKEGDMPIMLMNPKTKPSKPQANMDQILGNIEKNIPKDDKNKKKYIEEFGEVLLAKIDGEDTPKNKMVINLLISTLNNNKTDMNKDFKKALYQIINAKIINKLRATAHIGKGIITLLNWRAGDKNINDNFFEYNSDYMPYAQTQQIKNSQKNLVKNLTMVDIFLFGLFEVKEKNVQQKKITGFFNRFFPNVKVEDMNKNLIESDFLIRNYHGMMFMFEALDFFSIFDQIEIQKPIVKDNFKSSYGSKANDQERHILGEIFFMIYEIVVAQRLFLIKDKFENPIDHIYGLVEQCLVESYNREGMKDFAKSKCKGDYKVYENMLIFLRYYKDTQANQIKLLIKPISKQIDIKFYVDTAAFIIYLKRAPTSTITIDQICEENSESQFCLEFKFGVQIIENIHEESSFAQLIEILNEPEFKSIHENKFILWNVLDYISSVHQLDFENFFKSYNEHQEDESVKEFTDLITFKETEITTWVSDYLRLNYAHYSLKFNDMTNAIHSIMDKGQLENYLYEVERLEYNLGNEDVRIFHYNNVSMFLFFSHTKNNYQLLANTLKEKAWLVMLIKKNISHILKSMDEMQTEVQQMPKTKSFEENLQSFISEKNEILIANNKVEETDDFFGKFGDDDLIEDPENQMSNEENKRTTFNEDDFEDDDLSKYVNTLSKSGKLETKRVVSTDENKQITTETSHTLTLSGLDKMVSEAQILKIIDDVRANGLKDTMVVVDELKLESTQRDEFIKFLQNLEDKNASGYNVSFKAKAELIKDSKHLLI